MVKIIAALRERLCLFGKYQLKPKENKNMCVLLGIIGGLIGSLILLAINSYLEIKDVDDETFTKPKLRDYDKEQRD